MDSVEWNAFKKVRVGKMRKAGRRGDGPADIPSFKLRRGRHSERFRERAAASTQKGEEFRLKAAAADAKT